MDSRICARHFSIPPEQKEGLSESIVDVYDLKFMAEDAPREKLVLHVADCVVDKQFHQRLDQGTQHRLLNGQQQAEVGSVEEPPKACFVATRHA